VLSARLLAVRVEDGLAANVDLASETADIGVLGDGLVGNMPERTGLSGSSRRNL